MSDTPAVAADAIDGSFAPEQSPSTVTVELDGEAVIYDESTARVHVLNPTAAVLWACFDGSGTLDELVGDLAEAYGQDRATIAPEVLAVARQLGSQGLLAGVAPSDELSAERDARAGAFGDTREAEPVTLPKYVLEPPSG